MGQASKQYSSVVYLFSSCLSVPWLSSYFGFTQGTETQEMKDKWTFSSLICFESVFSHSHQWRVVISVSANNCQQHKRQKVKNSSVVRSFYLLIVCNYLHLINHLTYLLILFFNYHYLFGSRICIWIQGLIQTTWAFHYQAIYYINSYLLQ